MADPIAVLNRDLRADPLRLKYQGPSGYLRSTLDALHVPIESQIALFGQDSLQRERISTLNPRAIFFNDAVSVAWVRGGFIEVASRIRSKASSFTSSTTCAKTNRSSRAARIACRATTRFRRWASPACSIKVLAG